MIPPLNELRVVGIFAHPDDETRVAGTLAAFAARGASVRLICATRGERGRRPETVTSPEELGRIREAELRAAAHCLGVERVDFLGYPESGPRRRWARAERGAFARQPESECAEALERHLRDFRPDIVVTWDALGGYWHQDHVAIHRAVMLAVRRGAGRPGLGDPWRPRVFWPPPEIRSVRARVFSGLAGALPRLLARPFRAQLRRWEPPVTHRVDVSKFLAEKLAARAAHASQLRTLTAGPSRGDQIARSTMELFVQGWPRPAAGTPLREGLEGLVSD